MAPARFSDLDIDHASAIIHLKVPNHEAPKSVFPDGIRTSGQHSPIYDLLKPYKSFPAAITGPTVWRKEDFADHPEKWTHPFTDEEIAEIGAAADQFIEQKIPLTGIAKVWFTASFCVRSDPKSVVVADNLLEDGEAKVALHGSILGAFAHSVPH